MSTHVDTDNQQMEIEDNVEDPKILYCICQQPDGIKYIN